MVVLAQILVIVKIANILPVNYIDHQWLTRKKLI
jgi:hypothetical protein